MKKAILKRKQLKTKQFWKGIIRSKIDFRTGIFEQDNSEKDKSENEHPKKDNVKQDESEKGRI